jgi:YesN/AraC family two-component response regulator
MKTILIVDDEQEMRELLGRHLHRWLNVDILLAENGKEGLDIYRKHRPDIVLLDVVMPVMAGDEAMNKILELEPKANIIIVTGYDNEFSKEKAMKLGAKGYLSKPIDLNELKKLIESLNQEVKEQ